MAPFNGSMKRLAQDMFRSNVATGMYSYLKVKEANLPPPSVPAEPPVSGRQE
jgi:hypothetical protein